ncbi:hypothetical protein SAMN02745751_00537 [Dethiosulfatibacter aminovorans DSM 17477]|uniref:4Fe-4S ferredoxin-type domain-containing protein n=1 Tax=Dethiosulfatibacter aminovorans DSM 17477 TaxID=1121476 RepID=A0A1M6C0E7_9FIRM|nr:aldo/keto reductase [Dethiosulfatibacter aminovorans]SHI54492.1 hypothetical protein SAMN02745751_00537 [Dethiosulfatibacter aminovorans DSM 17477]
MIYKDFKDLKLSTLGMGTMRLPVIEGQDSNVDEKATREMVAYAMEHGINYFDTAWAYHGGNSEIAIGKALSEYPRDSYYLADKFPGYDLSNMTKIEEIFDKQLEKCRVDYFDFYMFHNVCEMNIDAYLDEKYDLFSFLMKQKELGRIKHLGFSAHGSYDVIKRFLEAYGEHMEFGQLQVNYLDWIFQEASRKVELLDDYNIPVWVMEPLRGGRLAKLNEEETATLKSMRPGERVPAWAFRYLQSLPSVKVVLSGMSNYEQMKENLGTYETDQPLSEKEMESVMKMASQMLSSKILPCTACNYCVSHCPQELNIPELIGLFNEHRFTEGGFIAPMALMAIPEEKQPSACIGCGNCEKVCPQQISISKVMKEFAGKVKM